VIAAGGPIDVAAGALDDNDRLDVRALSQRGVGVRFNGNCIDRPSGQSGPSKPPILWERRDPSEDRRSPTASCTTSSAAGERTEGEGRKKANRVTIYLPMIPRRRLAMLACARIGANPLRGVRRVFAGQPRRPHRGLPLDVLDHAKR